MHNRPAATDVSQAARLASSSRDVALLPWTAEKGGWSWSPGKERYLKGHLGQVNPKESAEMSPR